MRFEESPDALTHGKEHANVQIVLEGGGEWTELVTKSGIRCGQLGQCTSLVIRRI